MSSSKEKLNYRAVTKQPALHSISTSRHVADFCCLNYFHSFRAEEKRNSYEKVFRNHIFWEILMPKEKKRSLNTVIYKNYLKIPFAIYVGFETILDKISSCCNNPEGAY